MSGLDGRALGRPPVGKEPDGLLKGLPMCIENWSDNVILVSLPDQPNAADWLEDVTVLVANRDDCDVVVDCSQAGHMGPSSFQRLLELDGTLSACGHQLVLCGPQGDIKRSFAAPFGTTVKFADDRFSALAGVGLSRL